MNRQINRICIRASAWKKAISISLLILLTGLTDYSKVVAAESVEGTSSPENQIIAKTNEVSSTPPKARTVAIFVENRAGEKLNDQVLPFEDAVASQLASSDFVIIFVLKKQFNKIFIR